MEITIILVFFLLQLQSLAVTFPVNRLKTSKTLSQGHAPLRQSVFPQRLVDVIEPELVGAIMVRNIEAAQTEMEGIEAHLLEGSLAESNDAIPADQIKLGNLPRWQTFFDRRLQDLIKPEMAVLEYEVDEQDPTSKPLESSTQNPTDPSVHRSYSLSTLQKASNVLYVAETTSAMPDYLTTKNGNEGSDSVEPSSPTQIVQSSPKRGKDSQNNAWSTVSEYLITGQDMPSYVLDLTRHFDLPNDQTEDSTVISTKEDEEKISNWAKVLDGRTETGSTQTTPLFDKTTESAYHARIKDSGSSDAKMVRTSSRILSEDLKSTTASERHNHEYPKPTRMTNSVDGLEYIGGFLVKMPTTASSRATTPTKMSSVRDQEAARSRGTSVNIFGVIKAGFVRNRNFQKFYRKLRKHLTNLKNGLPATVPTSVKPEDPQKTFEQFGPIVRIFNVLKSIFLNNEELRKFWSELLKYFRRS